MLKKLIFRLIAVMVLGVLCADANGQVISIGTTSTSIKKAFEKIEQQTGIMFAYRSSDLRVRRVVQLSAPTLELRKLMDELLKDSQCEYKLVGKYLTIRRIEVVEQPVQQMPKKPKPEKPKKPEKFFTYEKPVTPPAVLTREIATLAAPDTDIYTEEFLAKSRLQPAAEPKPEPRFAIKTNLLYGAATLTPNLAAEVSLGNGITIEASVSYNGRHRRGTLENNTKLVHSIARAELRYYLGEVMNGHFVGAHGFYAGYNIAGYSVPMFLPRGSGPYRYEGDVIGGGVSYGYSRAVWRNFAVEATIGAGYGWMRYKRYYAYLGGQYIEMVKRPYYGITRGGVSLVYRF